VKRRRFPSKLVLHNASGHPPNVSDFSENIKVVFPLPQHIIPQPKDQGIIANFESHYLHKTFFRIIMRCMANDTLRFKGFWHQINIKMARKFICDAWNEPTSCCMNGVWKKVWP
jgi:hypothetical protein